MTQNPEQSSTNSATGVARAEEFSSQEERVSEEKRDCPRKVFPCNPRLARNAPKVTQTPLSSALAVNCFAQPHFTAAGATTCSRRLSGSGVAFSRAKICSGRFESRDQWGRDFPRNRAIRRRTGLLGFDGSQESAWKVPACTGTARVRGLLIALPARLVVSFSIYCCVVCGEEEFRHRERARGCVRSTHSREKPDSARVNLFD